MAGLLRDFLSKWQYLTAQQAMQRAPMLTMGRLLSWRARCLARRAAIVPLPRLGGQLLLPANWRGVEKLIFSFRDLYEPELDFLQQVLAPGMTLIDVGACYGIYTLAASKMVGQQGRVIAFEPASRAFRVLKENIALNGLTNVLAYPMALSDTNGQARLYHHPNVGCDSLGKDGSFTETAEVVPIESLDSVLRKCSIDQVDVIKMDVEGAEELVLRGARATLKTNRPIVIFEIRTTSTAALGLRSFGAWEFLDSLGYKFFVAGRSGVLQAATTPPDNRNVVAVLDRPTGFWS